MSTPSVNITPASTFDLVDDSTLTYFIPLATKFNVEEAFKNDVDKSEEPFSSVERRESLFFGMSFYISSKRSIFSPCSLLDPRWIRRHLLRPYKPPCRRRCLTILPSKCNSLSRGANRQWDRTRPRRPSSLRSHFHRASREAKGSNCIVQALGRTWHPFRRWSSAVFRGRMEAIGISQSA